MSATPMPQPAAATPATPAPAAAAPAAAAPPAAARAAPAAPGRAWAALRGLLPAVCAALLLAAVPAAWAARTQQTFATPEEAGAALAAAARANDAAALVAILGRGGRALVVSGDPVADAASRARFAAAYDKAHRVAETHGRATLEIGMDRWPLPIPLVKAGERWRFDTRQGRDELLRRRIGRNEIGAMQVCLAILDAQREYGLREARADGTHRYAERIVSTPGRRDGLYWEAPAGEAPSPLGPFVAAAAAEGYGAKGAKPLAPYHGYYYRIVARSGEAGYAVAAWPARYGASGIMSFVAERDGTIRQRDLGRGTSQRAALADTFTPGAGWTPVPATPRQPSRRAGA